MIFYHFWKSEKNMVPLSEHLHGDLVTLSFRGTLIENG